MDLGMKLGHAIIELCLDVIYNHEISSHDILRGSPAETRMRLLRCIQNGRPLCQAFTGRN